MINKGGLAASTIAFTDADFQVVSRYAAEKYGLEIKMEKKGLIYARLARRVRALELPDFKAYCDLVTGPDATVEQVELLSALTTNVSSFFREKHHFESLRRDILPALRQKAESVDGLNIWSAGCSAGQEAYSIAAIVQETWPDASRLNVKILGTDVDTRILERACAATYRPTEMTGLSTQQQQQLFGRSNTVTDAIKVRDDLCQMVTFKTNNLISRWSFAKSFDIIFCRNVVIYFDRETQHLLWKRFSDTLEEKGHLVIGHSERLSGPAVSSFTNAGITTFTKNTL